MRTGVCLLMLATKEDPVGKSYISLVSKAGYDYAEVPLGRLLDMSEAEITALRAEFDAVNLPVEVFNCSLMSGVDLMHYEQHKDVLDAYIEKAVKAAEILGVKIITMCGPIRDWAPEGTTWEDGLPSYVQFLRAYADRAAKAGVVLAIEPINAEENGYVSTVATAMEAVKAAGRENVRVIVDTYHFFKQGDDFEAMLKLCPEQVVHLHLGTKVKRVFPLEADRAECLDVLRPLIKAGYNARISVEARTADPENDLPETKKLLDSIFVQVESEL